MAIIQAEKREGTGKGVARSMRREGRLPAVLYGGGRDNVNLSVSSKEWMEIVEKNGSSLRTQRQTLVIDKKAQQMVLLRGFQVHPVTGNPVHVDFMRFNPKQKVEVEVPVIIIGEEECPGVKEGGMVEQIRRVLEVQCLAGDIPESFEISIASMEIGDTVHIEDIEMPEGVVVNTDANFTIVNISAPTVEEVDTEGPIEEIETEVTTEKSSNDGEEES
ncbi:MAG: 50S ribosomal protein L25/general stress protein Ctc [Magnetococcales bacterium]|nr:50S ribosomal protein L25/general stress protein Ctc [Magnetococcales bacterium]